MLFKNDIFSLEGSRHRLLDCQPTTDDAWVIAVDDKAAWPRRLPWSAISGFEAAPQEAVALPESSLSEASKQRAKAAMSALRPLLQHGSALFIDQQRYRLIRDCARVCKVSVPSVYKWLRMFWQNGQTEMALLPHYSNCGRSEKGVTGGRGAPPRHGRGIYQLTQQDTARFDEVIKRHYLVDERVTLTQTYQRLLEYHYTYLDGNGKAYLLPPGERPSYRQLQNYLRKNYSAELILRKRLGSKEFELKHRSVLGTVMEDCLGVGHWYECDATIADVFLVAADDVQTIIGKPTLYFIIDRYSRLIVGFYVGLENPSLVCAKEALLSISEDKRALCERYDCKYDPDDWPAHMVYPAGVLVDLGEWNSRGGEQLGRNLATRVSFVPSKRADWKPVIESQWKLTRTALQDGTPGFDPPENAKKRQGKHYEQDACLTLHEFTKLILHLIIKHNRTPLREFPLEMSDLRMEFVPTPVNIWNRDVVKRSGLLTRYSAEYVRMQLLPEDEASVTEHGIEFKGCLYTGQSALTNGWFTYARNSRFKVKVSYDHRLVDNVYAHDPNGRAAPFLCDLSPRSEKHRGRSFAEVKVYEELEASLKPDLEHMRLQAAADFHAATQPAIDASRARLQGTPAKASRSARRADTKEAREKERSEERKKKAAFKSSQAPEHSQGSSPTKAEVVDLSQARARQPLGHAPQQHSESGASATAAALNKPLSLAEKVRLARQKLKDENAHPQ